MPCNISPSSAEEGQPIIIGVKQRGCPFKLQQEYVELGVKLRSFACTVPAAIPVVWSIAVSATTDSQSGQHFVEQLFHRLRWRKLRPVSMCKLERDVMELFVTSTTHGINSFPCFR